MAATYPYTLYDPVTGAPIQPAPAATSRYTLNDAAGNPLAIQPAVSRSVPPPGSLHWSDYADEASVYDPKKILDAQRRGWEKAGVTAAIGAGGEIAQMALSAIPTAQDRENTKRLAELAAHKGLTQAERAELDASLLNPVRAMSAENQLRDEALVAGMGSGDLGALTRARAAGDARETQASIQAGEVAAKINQQRVEADRLEEQQRIAYKSEAARARLERIGQIIGNLGEQFGKVYAAQADVVRADDADLLAMQAARNPDGSAVYPGLQTMTLDQIRVDYAAALKGKDTTGFGEVGAAE